MITVRAISGPATVLALKTVKGVTGEPLSLIKQRIRAGEVFLSCPYPHHEGRLTEFVDAVEALGSQGLVLDIHEVWPGGDSRSITLGQLVNLITLDRQIAAADEGPGAGAGGTVPGVPG